MAMRALSLKGRAVAYLARREHSRAELLRKLSPHAESPGEVEKVLDALEHSHLLSPERFAESLVHRRARRFGTARIRAELRQHDLSPEVVATQVEALKATEVVRAREVWEVRFGVVAATMQERHRQMRFLAQRGFSTEAIRAVVGADYTDPAPSNNPDE